MQTFLTLTLIWRVYPYNNKHGKSRVKSVYIKNSIETTVNIIKKPKLNNENNSK